jgi:hypothetical protein
VTLHNFNTPLGSRPPQGPTHWTGKPPFAGQTLTSTYNAHSLINTLIPYPVNQSRQTEQIMWLVAAFGMTNLNLHTGAALFTRLATYEVNPTCTQRTIH